VEQAELVPIEGKQLSRSQSQAGNFVASNRVLRISVHIEFCQQFVIGIILHQGYRHEHSVQKKVSVRGLVHPHVLKKIVRAVRDGSNRSIPPKPALQDVVNEGVGIPAIQDHYEPGPLV
jgi:hypothetical protein